MKEIEKGEGVYVVWKNKGLTMGGLLEQFKKDHPEIENESVTYAGRLDPMAEGVVILLVGDAVYKKDEFLHLDKEYEFEALWGLETDTQDILGLVCKVNQSTCHVDGLEVEKVAQSFIGKQIQRYPAYSSRKVRGKPMFEWAREGRLHEIKIPEHEVEIYSLEILSQYSISGAELLKTIEENISKVKGDFRQEEIVRVWKKTLNPLKDTEFFITKMKAKVLSGTYIRSLVEQMGNKLESGAVAYSITRTEVVERSDR